MKVISVAQLNHYVKTLLEGDPNLASVQVCGEISNFTHHYQSGHMYMTLKDDGAAVRAVMFKWSASKLQFRPEDGMRVIVRARVSLYENTGGYQIYIDEMQPDGVGALQVAFEQLKKKLAAEGLFDDSRKKPLPKYPTRVGVITSPTGAAVRDILNVLGRRYPLADVVFCPVLVQGEGAAPSIVEAIRRFNAASAADLLIVGRGGGSIEDLWAFNEESVARAVAESAIPVISAVGHETDFTICDFVADLRAPTPSAAAELAVPDAGRLLSFMDNVRARLSTATRNHVSGASARLSVLKEKRCLSAPQYYTEEQSLRLDYLTRRFVAASQQQLGAADRRLAAAASKLDALSPLKVLGRGYSIGYTAAGEVLDSVNRVQVGESLRLRLADGTLRCEVTEKQEA
ncbi:MAG: exodeoxyribonuclease VII large subunit [Ruminococcaceae bacterium]|nr:exodeoxyribonuclease VII large subunit [Oscillospiraceae bacterium]